MPGVQQVDRVTPYGDARDVEEGAGVENPVPGGHAPEYDIEWRC